MLKRNKKIFFPIIFLINNNFSVEQKEREREGKKGKETK
jgi:hypothetical protein